MRLKKIFGLFLVLCLSLFAFTACSSDNEEEEQTATYEYQISYSKFAGSLSNMNVVTNAFVKAFGVESTPLKLTGTLKECDRLAKEYAIKAAAEIGTEANFSATVDFRNVNTDQTVYTFEITKSDNGASTEDIAKDEILGIWQLSHVEGWTYDGWNRNLIEFEDDDDITTNFSEINKDLTENDEETIRLVLLKNGSCVGLVTTEDDGFKLGFYGDYYVSDGKITIYYVDSRNRKSTFSVDSYSSDKMVLVQNLKRVGVKQRTTTWKKISDSDNVETGIVGKWKIMHSISKTVTGSMETNEKDISDEDDRAYRIIFLPDGSFFILTKNGLNWYDDGFDFDMYGKYEISGNKLTISGKNIETMDAEFSCENDTFIMKYIYTDNNDKTFDVTDTFKRIK